MTQKKYTRHFYAIREKSENSKINHPLNDAKKSILKQFEYVQKGR
jgi:hypothetical protein